MPYKIRGMRIAIIDDEEDIAFILSYELRRLGHQTVSFLSAIDAQAYLSKESVDAILCDFQMPRMNGMELLSWLKSQNIQTPFYILTGEPTMDKEELLKSGVKDILFKPGDLLRISLLFK
jgi:DNA-binding response OmpR family regulator